MLVDGASSINLFGEQHQVKATVHTVGGLSAHADHQGLIDWYEHFSNRPSVKLVHGEDTPMEVLVTDLKRRFDADVSIAEYGETFRFQ